MVKIKNLILWSNPASFISNKLIKISMNWVDTIQSKFYSHPTMTVTLQATNITQLLQNMKNNNNYKSKPRKCC